MILCYRAKAQHVTPQSYITPLIQTAPLPWRCRYPLYGEIAHGKGGAYMAKGLYKEWTEGDGLIKVQGWARKGLSNDQIAENIGINRKTLYEWCNKYSNFRDALKKTKEITVYEVEDAMFKAAKGYYVTETKTITNKDGKVIRIENHKKWIAPSTTAQIFFLKNKDPENWRERNDISITESNGVLESLMALHNGKDNVE